MISVLIQVTQPATGVSFMQGYGVYFFEIAGSTQPFQDGIIVNCAGLAGVLISIWMMKKFRRRPVLLMGSAGLGLSIFLTALVYTIDPTADWSKKCVVAFIVIYVFFYFLVYSPYPFLISGEVPNQRLRNYTFGLAGATSYFGSWLVGFTAPYFLNPTELNWGPKYGWIWVGSNILVAIWVFFCVPETFMRTLEGTATERISLTLEIEEMFEKRIPTRKWTTYVTQGVATAVEVEIKGISTHQEEIEGRDV
jgi:MFS transporter, SP family, sugar:H+ symporter